MDHAWAARDDTRTRLRSKPRRSLAKLYFDTLVFEREQLRHLVNLWGSGHLVIGTDYPFDMGAYDPRGFVEGCAFLTAADRAKILGRNAAKLLRLGRARGRP
jgi:aminocarboxymuconate-semialdehyde decarboxylase